MVSHITGPYRDSLLKVGWPSRRGCFRWRAFLQMPRRSEPMVNWSPVWGLSSWCKQWMVLWTKIPAWDEFWMLKWIFEQTHGHGLDSDKGCFQIKFTYHNHKPDPPSWFLPLLECNLLNLLRGSDPMLPVLGGAKEKHSSWKPWIYQSGFLCWGPAESPVI